MPDLIKYELPDVHIRWGESVDVTTAPVSPGGRVDPVGLEIDPDVAPHLTVNDLKVGRNSQLTTAASIPATLFASSPPVALRFDELSPGLRFTLSVTCANPLGVTFKGRLLAESPSAPVEGKMYAIGFGYTRVRAGETVEVLVTNYVEMQLMRLHVPPHLLDVFRVDALFQGRYLDVEQASRVVDSSQFDKESLARGGEIDLEPSDVVGVGCPVTVRVTNTSENVQYFSAALLGDPICDGNQAVTPTPPLPHLLDTHRLLP